MHCTWAWFVVSNRRPKWTCAHNFRLKFCRATKFIWIFHRIDEFHLRFDARFIIHDMEKCERQKEKKNCQEIFFRSMNERWKRVKWLMGSDCRVNKWFSSCWRTERKHEKSRNGKRKFVQMRNLWVVIRHFISRFVCERVKIVTSVYSLTEIMIVNGIALTQTRAFK